MQNRRFLLHFLLSNLSLYSLHYAKACNEFAGPISVSLRPGNKAPSEEMLQRWRAVGNSVSDLTGPRFELQTSRSKYECVATRPTGWSIFSIALVIFFGNTASNRFDYYP